MDAWEELDALVAGLRSENTAWAERIDALAGEAETLGKLTADVDRQYEALGVREAFEALAQAVLAGAATIYEARRPFGYSRQATLAWHAGDDPRAAFADEPRDSLLTLDVAVGPRLLLDGGGDAAGAERLTVLIMGDKRLLATLPTSRERFRAALLRAFAAPRHGQDAQAASNEPTATETAANADRAATFAGEVAADRAGTDEAAATAEAAGSSDEPPANHAEPHAEASGAGEATEPTEQQSAAEPGETGAASEAEAASEGEPAAAQNDETNEKHGFREPPDVIAL
jgi:hypothetical protein